MKLAKQQKEMYSLESEQSVLGSLLVKNDCFDEVSAIIHTEDFYIVHHKIIFNAISSLLHQGQPVDILTLEQKLKEEKNFQENGTLAYIAELVKNTPSATNAKLTLNSFQNTAAADNYIVWGSILLITRKNIVLYQNLTIF